MVFSDCQYVTEKRTVNVICENPWWVCECKNSFASLQRQFKCMQRVCSVLSILIWNVWFVKVVSNLGPIAHSNILFKQTKEAAVSDTCIRSLLRNRKCFGGFFFLRLFIFVRIIIFEVLHFSIICWMAAFWVFFFLVCTHTRLIIIMIRVDKSNLKNCASV